MNGMDMKKAKFVWPTNLIYYFTRVNPSITVILKLSVDSLKYGHTIIWELVIMSLGNHVSPA